MTRDDGLLDLADDADLVAPLTSILRCRGCGGWTWRAHGCTTCRAYWITRHGRKDIPA